MTERRIPHDPTADPKQHNHWAGNEKRWTRKLAERGKLTARFVKIPHYGRVNDMDPKR